MSEESKKSITIGCGAWGPAISAVIIASRAICGSFPMEEWSAWSWFLMLIPATIPLAVAALMFLMFLVALVIEAWTGRRI